jgi:tetratricopeptide (TPR) repeat protein
MNQGKLREAEAIYKELISEGTNNHITYGNLAKICGMQSRFDELKELIKKALELNPNYPEAHNYLGNSLKQQGDIGGAIKAYNNAIQLNPSYAKAHNNMGVALQKQRDLAASIDWYNTAIRLNSNFPEAHYNLANALQEQGNIDAAIASYNAALQLKPNYPEAHNNLGVALQEQGELAAAITAHNTALQLKPNFPEAHYNLGLTHQQQGDLDAAIASYNTALQLKPNYADANCNSSLTMLLGGDYKNGWEKYEWRSRQEKDAPQPHAAPKCAQWIGKQALYKTSQLLLVTEQGLGDTLQFMRYASVLRNQNIALSFCAPTKLHTLIQASGIDPSPLTPQQADEVAEGQWMPLLSVPKYLEVSPDNPVITEPYIKTTDELIANWASILVAEERPIVGINWQGNPKTEKTVLRGRSLALETFAPIIEGSQISLLSLQKGFGSEQLEKCSFKDRFVNCQDQVNDTWDFLETAAIIANCDLVITSDTSVAHLAGGMGKITWLLLHKVPDWRWGLEGATTFWYPSMRLFRQKERGNWKEVMEQVAEALQEHFGGDAQAAQAAPAPAPRTKPDLS